MTVLIQLAALTATVLVLARVVPGVKIKNPVTAVVVAVVFSLLNVLIGWLIAAALVLPSILTLGLLLLFIPFIVNAVLLWGTDKILKGFEVTDFQSLLISAGAITLVNFVLHRIF